MEQMIREFEQSAAALERRIQELRPRKGCPEWQKADLQRRAAILQAELADLRATIHHLKGCRKEAGK